MPSYSFLDVVATINGPGISINLAAGAAVAEEGISFEFEGDKGNLVIGAGGETMHSLRASQSGTATFRLLKTSPVNAALQIALNAQRQSSLTWGKNVISLNDTARGDKVLATSVAFKKGTGLTYAANAGMNEWAFAVGHLTMMLGVGT